MYLRDPSKGSTKLTLQTIEFIQHFAGKVELKSKFVFTDILNSMLALASSKEKFLNEDFKFQIVNCIQVMLKSADDDLMKEFYKEESKLPISHLVFTSLEWMEQEKSPRLKLDCIAVLDALLERRSSEFDSIFHALLPGNILYMLCNVNVKLFDMMS